MSLTTSQTSLASGRLESILGLWCHRCIAGGFSIVGVAPRAFGKCRKQVGDDTVFSVSFRVVDIICSSWFMKSVFLETQRSSIRVGQEIMMWYVYQDYKTPLFEFLYLKHVTLIRSVWEIPSYFSDSTFPPRPGPCGATALLGQTWKPRVVLAKPYDVGCRSSRWWDGDVRWWQVACCIQNMHPMTSKLVCAQFFDIELWILNGGRTWRQCQCMVVLSHL